ncbi:MAG: hypothetical protein ACP5TL_00280 [Candidatus Micrarchaeia archaeon]
MKYAREHIKRYWIFEYRRAIGISMLTFSIALSIGVVFTSLLYALSISIPVYEIVFWSLLIILTALVFITNFVNAHLLSIKYMTNEEYKKHTKYMGGWLTILIAGAILFTLPILFFQSFYEPLIILFGFGGVLWVLFFSIKILFKYSYYEVAIGASAFWIVVLMSTLSIMSFSSSISNQYVIESLSIFISILSLIVITGFTGMSLLVNASNEFSHEFKRISEVLDKHAPIAKGKKGSATRKR